MEDSRLTPPRPEAPQETAGQGFVKMLKPIGCVLFLLFFVLFLLYCFLPHDNSVEGYTAPHDSEYYAQSSETLAELQAELEENLLPRLSGVVSCEMGDGVIAVTTEKQAYAAVRDAVLYYYSPELFTFSAA